MKKTVLIIGAGASKDYGYPLWIELREQLEALNISEFLREIGSLSSKETKEHEEVYGEFLKTLESHPTYTLDRIIYEIDKPKEKHLNPTGYLILNIVGYLLAKKEVEEKEGFWVTNLQEVLVDYMSSNFDAVNHNTNIFENLSVVSFNYDRVFEYHISKGFFKKLIEHPKYKPRDLTQSLNLSNSASINIFKPHGFVSRFEAEVDNDGVGMNSNLQNFSLPTIGTRKSNQYHSIPYGSVELLEKREFLLMGKNMYVVNERRESDYLHANKALQAAENIICLGLSEQGIVQSHLDFKKGQNVFLSNKREDITIIKSLKEGPNYETLNKDGSRLDAKDFPEIFNNIINSK